MSYSTINILAVTVGSNSVSNSNVFSITLTTSDYTSGKQFIEDIIRRGGAFAVDSGNNEVWVPTSAITRVTLT